MMRFGTENALSQKGIGARRENTAYLTKNVRVLHLSCVVYGQIYSRFMGFYVNVFFLYNP